ncbi:6-bladed beta-propeller [Prolixibacteraceae bacterium JC049]|nr:6-bladed beta-propeller [Prolixibacteraceae bacterium JC049]
MRHLITYSIIALTLFAACSKPKQQQTKETTPPPAKKREMPYHISLAQKSTDTLRASQIATEVKFIPLETKKASLFSRIFDFRLTDSTIGISDMTSLKLFDHKGKFLCQIGKRGKGPGEYNYIFNFEFKQDSIYLTSTTKRLMAKHTIGGKFIKEIKFKNREELVNFRINKDNQTVWYDRGDGYVAFFNEKMEEQAKFRYEDASRHVYSISTSFLSYMPSSDSLILLNNYINDTIFHVTPAGKKPAFIFDMKEKLLPKMSQVEYCKGDFKRFFKTAAPYQMVNLVHNKNWVLVFQKQWSDDIHQATFVHNIKANKTESYVGPFIKDDITSGQTLTIQSQMCSSQYLVSYIPAVDVLEMCEQENQNSPMQKAWVKQMKNIDPESNGVLALIKLK